MNRRCIGGVLFFLSFSAGATAQSLKSRSQFPAPKADTVRPVILLSQMQIPERKKLLVAPDQHTQHFGFFCRQELKLDRRTPIPVRVRLGSMEQCNFLERKK